MQVVLAMFKPGSDRRSFSLHKDQTVIGRREDCDLRIPLGEISRKHCRISVEGETLRLEDLGSSNGTYVNGQRVQEATVAAGDTIQMGSIAFVLQLDGVPADDDLHPTLYNAPPNEETDTPSKKKKEKKKQKSEVPEGEFDPMAVLENDDSALDASGMDLNFEQSPGESTADA